MKSLFLDNTDETTLGVLDENFRFEEWLHFEDKKSASLIHSRLNELLEKCGLDTNDIQRIYIVSGPGSYTGLRVVDGIAQIMQWQGKEIISFYQFEIPFMSGIRRGKWISQAWKGELFVYSWDNGESCAELVPLRDYPMVGEEYSFGEECAGSIVQSCRKLLLDHSTDIFASVTKRGEYLPPYYYRELEQEFRPNP